MPWDVTDDYIRSGHENPDKYDSDSLRTITIDDDKGIKAIIGCPKGNYTGGKCKVGTQIQSYLFMKDKGWTMDKAKAWFKSHEESLPTAKITIKENLVPFKFSAVAAVPGKSLNNRVYTEQVLRNATPLYKGKPFIMDHDITKSERVIGLITDSKYEGGIKVEGLGLMEKDLFDKVAGTDKIPPLIKGVSIGGEGEGENSLGGLQLSKFIPEELSLTAFPGIPEAQLTQIEMIMESYKRMEGEKMDKEEITEVKTENGTEIVVPLEVAEKMAKEGPMPTSPDSTRFNPPNVTQPPLMGGHQTGGHVANPPITQPTPSAPSEIDRVKTQAIPKEEAEEAETEEDRVKSKVPPDKVQPKEPPSAVHSKTPETGTLPKVVDSKSVSLSPGQIGGFEVTSKPDVVKRAQELLKQMNGDAKKAYLLACKEILSST
jgi:hypothetical protein